MKRNELGGCLAGFWRLLKARDFHALLSEPTDNTVVQLSRYCLVGFSSFLVDFCLLFLLELAGLHYLPAAGLSFSVAACANFLLTKFFVFKAVDPTVGPGAEVFIFLCIALIGLSLTVALMAFFTEFMHFHFLVSKVISALLVFSWNFFGRKLILYRGHIHPAHS